MAGRASFPAPRDDDHEDVYWALKTALSLDARGDSDDALRWLHKAVEVAAASRHRSRAVELGRIAVDLERRIVADRLMSSEPLPSAEVEFPEDTERNALRQSVRDTLTDAQEARHHELGAAGSSGTPGFVNSANPVTLVDGDGHPGYDIDAAATQVPFTQLSAGASGGPAVSSKATASATRIRRLKPAVSRTLKTADHDSSPNASVPVPHEHGRPVYDDDDATMAMRRPPNLDDIESGSFSECTMPAVPALTRFRVALLASSDGHEPRVILLDPGASAPPGAGVATLVPVSTTDAETIRQMLDAERSRR